MLEMSCQFTEWPHRDKPPFTLTFTPGDNLDFPISLGSRRTQREPGENPVDSGRTCKLYTEGQESNLPPPATPPYKKAIKIFSNQKYFAEL